MRSKSLLLACSLAIGFVLSQPASASQESGVVKKRRADAQEPAKPAERKPEQKPEQKPAPERKAPEGSQPAEGESGPPTKGDRVGDTPLERGLAKRYMLEEQKHRDRMARLNRLSELFEGKQDRAQHTEVQALIEKEKRRHTRIRGKAAEALGRANVQQVEQRIKQAEGRAAERVKGMSPGQRAKAVREKAAAGAGNAEGAAKGTERPAQGRPKPAPEEKGKRQEGRGKTEKKRGDGASKDGDSSLEDALRSREKAKDGRR